MKRLLLIGLLNLTVLSASAQGHAQLLCKDIFSNHQAHLTESTTATAALDKHDNWSDLFRKSDLSPRPQVWLRIRQALEKKVEHLQHRIELEGLNPDKIGAVYKSMIIELPILRTLLEVERRPTPLKHADFITLKHETANQLISVARAPRSDLQVFAALEALRLISTIETRVDFPRSPEEIAREQAEKREKEKKEKKKKDQPQDEEEEEPQWNKTQDQYKPENKDLSSDSSGKKKNANIAMTDADVPKRLLRQKIYDQFDYQKWSSVPVQRGQVFTDAQPTKRLIINPLGESEIDVPVPYGYSLLRGKYPNYQISEAGSGEFKLHVTDKKPVVLGLVKVQSETYTPSLPTHVPVETLNLWPQHLLMFAQSLKGLSPTEAAGRLEKYIAEDGGFLYYSKGDKINEEELARIDQKFNALLAQMPKPMAMAHVNAFNCDGAAWIGALLLRDVLNIPVRIAGGRTSAGITRIDGTPHHVVRSSDPAHAWLEVFDGKFWVPFDMTPKNNTPDSESAPTDLEREEPQPQDNKPPPKSQEQKSDKTGKPEKERAETDDGKPKDNPPPSEKAGETPAQSATEGETQETGRPIDEILKAKSTQRRGSEAQISLIDKILKRNELMLLEHLIYDGYQTKYATESTDILKALVGNPSWRNAVERSGGRISMQINDAKFIKYGGLQHLINETRVEFTQNRPRDAMQRLVVAQRFLLALADYRSLTPNEVEALNSIQKIISELGTIKHKNSKEFDVVADLLHDLPGNVSKDWLRRQYGKDFDQLGSASNVKLAQDLASGRLKPLLEMAAVSDFVDMTLNSTPEPRWKDEPTINRSIMPKPRQDLIVTRNPLDFAKMLWNLRPGENMFAPTLQGRQFAMGSLETRRVPNPKDPVERKVTVVYYDISGSMRGSKVETQDAILMALADKALSETDAIGRPTHEIYLIPFGDKRYEGVHISSREDALNFISKMMSYRTSANEGNAYTKFVEEFYELVASSYAQKSKAGRERLFQKANMILLTDGIYQVDLNSIQEAKRKLPAGVEVNMNFISIGDQVNNELKSLSEAGRLATKKPTFRQLTSDMIDAVVNVSTQFDPDAFATTERVSGSMLASINALLQKINVDPRQLADRSATDHALSQIQITKQQVNQLSGLREALNLSKLEGLVLGLNLNATVKHRLVEAIVESYPQITGRSWKDMTYQERDALEQLRKWSNR